MRDLAKIAAAAAAAESIARKSPQQSNSFLYQKVTLKLKSSPGYIRHPGVPGNSRTSG